MIPQQTEHDTFEALRNPHFALAKCWETKLNTIFKPLVKVDIYPESFSPRQCVVHISVGPSLYEFKQSMYLDANQYEMDHMFQCVIHQILDILI